MFIAPYTLTINIIIQKIVPSSLKAHKIKSYAQFNVGSHARLS